MAAGGRKGGVGSGEFSVTTHRKQRLVLAAEIEDVNTELAAIEQDNAFAAMLTEKVGHSFEHAAEIGKRFDALRLDQRQAIIRGLFGKIEVLSLKEAGIEGVGRVGMYLPDGYPYAVAEDEPDAMSESA